MDAPVIESRTRLAFVAVTDEAGLVERLRAGDEAAFVALVRMYQASLLRVAETVVGSRALAEESVQDTWLAVVRGIDRFEGRSSFKTWLFHILLNRARTSAGREFRTTPVRDDAIDDRFDANGAWASPPVPWSDRVEDRLVADHLASRVHDILPTLPSLQRQVVVLRDVAGLSAADVAATLGVSAGNQRVLLHRARAHIRECLAREIGTAS